MGSPAPMVRAREGIIGAVQAAIGPAFLLAKDEVDEVSIDVARDSVADVLTILRDRFEYQQLMEIAGVDYPERAERFEVNYHLLSVTHNHRIRLKVTTDEETPVPSLTGLWSVAGWLEREVFDMYGVVFAGNADLRRILTDYGFEGYPLRKDFPQTGYVELRYSEAEKRVVYEPVRLPQDFRNWDFLMPWEGAAYQLPGDEKAGQTQAAPTPSPAPNASPPASKAPPPTPKTTEKPSDTGAGAPANKAETKNARKPAAKKAEGPKVSTTPEPKSPRTARKKKGDDA